MTAGTGTVQVLRRSLTAFAPVGVMIAVVTVGMAVLATAVPRAVDGFLSDGLRYETQNAPAVARDLVASGIVDVPFGAGTGDGMAEGASEAWGLFDEQLGALRSTMPAALRAAVGPAEYASVTTMLSTTSPRSPSTWLSIAYDPRMADRVEIVEGEAPGPAPTAFPSEQPIEVVASRPVAELYAWGVGETRAVTLADGTDQPLLLSGLFEPRDADAGYWEYTTRTLEPSIDLSNLPPIVSATVFANAAGVTAVAGTDAAVALDSSFWYPTLPDRLRSSAAHDLARQTRQFLTVAHPLGSGTAPKSFRSNLPALLESAEARAVSSQTIVATITAGPIGLALAIEVLVARLVMARLRASLELMGARGASAPQRRLLLAVPALAVGVLAAAVGFVIGMLVPGGQLSPAAIVGVSIVAVAPAVLLVLLTESPRRLDGARGTRFLRPVAETVVVLAAAASLVTVLQRGNHLATSNPRVDLVAAAVPLFLSLVGCILVLRLYPVALRRTLTAAHAARGIAAFLGTARAMRAGSAGLVPVLAVVIGVSVAVFSGVLATSLSTGATTASQARVGADLSVENVRLSPADLDGIREVPGVEAVAGVARHLFKNLTPPDVRKFQASLVLVDPADLATVQRGVPGAIDLPPLVSQGGDAPAVAMSAGVDELAEGATESELDFSDEVRLIRPALTSQIFNTSQDYIVGDIANARQLNVFPPIVATQALVRLVEGGSVTEATAAIGAIAGPDAAFTTPADVAALRADNPAIGGIGTAAVLAVLGSIALSTAALGLSTVLDGRARRRSLALLATLGLGRAQARRTVAWELAPLAIVGLGAGVALGAALSAVVLTTVDLRPFTGGLDQPAVTVDPLLMLAVVGGFALLLFAAGIFAARQAAPLSRTATAIDKGWDS